MKLNGTWYSTDEGLREDIRKLFETLKWKTFSFTAIDSLTPVPIIL
jgi:hypothetical protein